MSLDLYTPEAVRQRCGSMLALAEAGGLRHLRFVPEKLNEAAAFVAWITRERFPDLRVPLHSRWRHFGAGGVDRSLLYPPDPAGRLELCTLSVLLDAGAGARWDYQEPESGLALRRSEGLAVASLHAYRAGLLRADPTSLMACSERSLAKAFQVTPTNKLEGLAGRAALLRRLGAVLSDAGMERLAELFAPLRAGGTVQARDILVLLLHTLRPIWPRLNGDVWDHPDLGPVPFHKLSQWLSYSLAETLEMEGITVSAMDALTGLAEYRNGGLMLDSGVLAFADTRLITQPLPVDHPAIVEWRALTVALLDRLAPVIRTMLGPAGATLSLGQILEGGTWEAGRRLALARRGDLSPPINIISDGSVF